MHRLDDFVTHLNLLTSVHPWPSRGLPKFFEKLAPRLAQRIFSAPASTEFDWQHVRCGCESTRWGYLILSFAVHYDIYYTLQLEIYDRGHFKATFWSMSVAWHYVSLNFVADKLVSWARLRPVGWTKPPRRRPRRVNRLRQARTAFCGIIRYAMERDDPARMIQERLDLLDEMLAQLLQERARLGEGLGVYLVPGSTDLRASTDASVVYLRETDARQAAGDGAYQLVRLQAGPSAPVFEDMAAGAEKKANDKDT